MGISRMVRCQRIPVETVSPRSSPRFGLAPGDVGDEGGGRHRLPLVVRMSDLALEAAVSDEPAVVVEDQDPPGSQLEGGSGDDGPVSLFLGGGPELPGLAAVGGAHRPGDVPRVVGPGVRLGIGPEDGPHDDDGPFLGGGHVGEDGAFYDHRLGSDAGFQRVLSRLAGARRWDRLYQENQQTSY